MTAPHLLVHHKADSVGVVVVEGVMRGQTLLGVVLDGDEEFAIVANVDTQIGHKIALCDLAIGADAVKYGHVIGRIVSPVHPEPQDQARGMLHAPGCSRLRHAHLPDGSGQRSLPSIQKPATGFPVAAAYGRLQFGKDLELHFRTMIGSA